MANLTSGSRPQPYGQGGRRFFLPVKATTQVYESGMAAQIAGACVPGTTTGAGGCIGVYETDALGGSADGSVRVAVMTDQVFIFKNGTNAVSDATPIGTTLYMEDDQTVGTGGIGGTGEGEAGKFVGFEDDGRVRVFVTWNGVPAVWLNGTAMTDTSTQSVVALGRQTRYAFASATMSQNDTVTLSTTGAVVGDVVKLVKNSVSAFTLAVVNGGAGTGTLCTLVASKLGWAQAYFDGTNWIFDGCSAT